ncbi:hypothetical protein HYV81_04950 [Candidatus Woesearchaeota archaeon]|nr:hypothetical protein [Candidatus Woesearchaeota archaeon]
MVQVQTLAGPVNLSIVQAEQQINRYQSQYKQLTEGIVSAVNLIRSYDSEFGKRQVDLAGLKLTLNGVDTTAFLSLHQAYLDQLLASSRGQVRGEDLILSNDQLRGIIFNLEVLNMYHEDTSKEVTCSGVHYGSDPSSPQRLALEFGIKVVPDGIRETVNIRGSCHYTSQYDRVVDTEFQDFLIPQDVGKKPNDKLNYALALWDIREPIGGARLARLGALRLQVMDQALLHLVRIFEKREAGAREAGASLEKLKGLEALAQPNLF